MRCNGGGAGGAHTGLHRCTPACDGVVMVTLVVLVMLMIVVIEVMVNIVLMVVMIHH